MIAASTRKAPNAFHFRRQIQILQKAGGGGVEQQFQDWHKATSVAKAFGIGRHESESVSNLMVNIQKDIVQELSAAVRSRGMSKFITHECLAKDVLNTSWSSGIGGTKRMEN